MFAEDVGLLPDSMFTKMLRQAHKRPASFATMASVLFGAMANKDGSVGFEPVAWFNGGLFDDDSALPLERDEIDTALKAAALDWSEIDPSILGTLFERGLDPDKRSQLGAHYTDRDKIMRIVEPVIVRPLMAEWEERKGEDRLPAIAMEDKAETAQDHRPRAGRGPSRSLRRRRFYERLSSKRLQDFHCARPGLRLRQLPFYRACTHSRTLEPSGFRLRPRRLGLQRRLPGGWPGKRQGASRSTPMRPSSPACRSGSAKSSGCGATGSPKHATRS